MDNRTRERVGLVIFFALLAVGGLILSAYFATGLTWTVYATQVDDHVGNMNGYVAVVYPGAGDAADALSREEHDAPTVEEMEQASIPAAADTMGLRIMSYYPGIGTAAYDGVYVSDVRDLYERKQADVLTVDPRDILAHPDPQILFAGGKRIGVFGVNSYMSRPVLEKKIEMLKNEGAEVIMCVAKRKAMLARLDGIQVLLLTDDAQNGELTGQRMDDTLVVSAPYAGEAGVIFLSNNNVASARSIDAL